MKAAEQMRNASSVLESPSSVSVVTYRSTKPSSVSSSAIALTVACSPLVCARQEPEERSEQRRGVQRVRVVVLAQDTTIADTMGKDFGLDFLRELGPFRLELVVAANRGELGGPVERNPAHQLRRDVMLGLAASLPGYLG